MPAIKERPEFEVIKCPKCHGDNIYEDDGLWYCNGCGEVWEGE